MRNTKCLKMFGEEKVCEMVACLYRAAQVKMDVEGDDIELFEGADGYITAYMPELPGDTTAVINDYDVLTFRANKVDAKGKIKFYTRLMESEIKKLPGGISPKVLGEWKRGYISYWEAQKNTETSARKRFSSSEIDEFISIVNHQTNKNRDK